MTLKPGKGNEMHIMPYIKTTGSAATISELIAHEHAAADEAHVTGLPLVHCQQYVRRNEELIDRIKARRREEQRRILCDRADAELMARADACAEAWALNKRVEVLE